MCVLLLSATRVCGQYDAYFSHYFDMQTSFNPAAAGKEAKMNVYGAYAMTMSGFENAPQTFTIAGDYPFSFLKSIHGVGAQLLSDKVGLFSHQKIALQYALRKKLAGGWISAGIQPGMLTEKFRGSEVDLADQDDPVFPKTDVDGNAFDLGAGLLYQRKNWYAGVSAQHITAPTVVLGEKNELKIDPMLYATGGMNFQLRNPLLKIAASALVQSDLTAYRADITGRLIYTYDQRMLYAGLNYSPTNSVSILIGGKFKGIVIGYSFEMYTSGIAFRNGSHEAFVGYQMDVDLSKKGKNFHQTTRTL